MLASNVPPRMFVPACRVTTGRARYTHIEGAPQKSQGALTYSPAPLRAGGVRIHSGFSESGISGASGGGGTLGSR